MSNTKKNLYRHCLTYVGDRIERIRNEIDLHQAAANEETRSSAGDKYETGRAMAQLEIERDRVQLREAEKLLSFLKSINLDSPNEMVVPGSLVTTSRGIFFLSISVGAVTLDQKSYFVVSPDSPVGKLLIGKRVGDEMVWRGEAYAIKQVE